MPTLTIQECLAAEPALSQLSQERRPAKVSYHIAKLLHLVRQELKIYQGQRDTVIKEMGVSRPPTPQERLQGIRKDVIEVMDDRREEFLVRDAEMTAVSVEIQWTPLVLKDLDGTDVAGSTLLAIGPLLTDCN